MVGDSQNEIMEATFRALCKHGYADLSIQKIADESEKGKSLIYYHFDDKEDLILEFLNFMKKKLEKEFEGLDDKSTEQNIDNLLDIMLAIENEKMWEFHRALTEIQARAQYNEGFAAKLKEIDNLIKEQFLEVLEEMNVEKPETISELLLSVIQGSISRKVSTDDQEGLKNLKEEIKSIMSSRISGQCPF